MARTTRVPERFVSPGAVNQHGGTLPLYVCNTCRNEVVWVESKKTGSPYLVNVLKGYHGQRFYVGRDIHKCEKVMAERAAWDTAIANWAIS